MQEEIRKRLHGPELGPCVYSQVRRLTRKFLSLCDTFFSPEDITTARSFLPRCSSFSFWLGRQPPEGRAKTRTKGPITHEKVAMYQYRLLSAIILNSLSHLLAGIYWLLERWC